MYESEHGSMYEARLRYQNSRKNAYNYHDEYRSNKKRDPISQEIINFVLQGTPLSCEFTSDKVKALAAGALQSIAGKQKLNDEDALSRFRFVNAIVKPGIQSQTLKGNKVPKRRPSYSYDTVKHYKPVVKDVLFMREAACRDGGSDSSQRNDVFFDNAPLSVFLAKQICASCPVQRECLDYALTNNEVYDVWGGATERERRKINSGKLSIDEFIETTLSSVKDIPPIDSATAW